MAKELMRSLKQFDYTNKEISILTGENGVSLQLNYIPEE